jgi:hypothetical protein
MVEEQFRVVCRCGEVSLSFEIPPVPLTLPPSQEDSLYEVPVLLTLRYCTKKIRRLKYRHFQICGFFVFAPTLSSSRTGIRYRKVLLTLYGYFKGWLLQSCWPFDEIMERDGRNFETARHFCSHRNRMILRIENAEPITNIIRSEANDTTILTPIDLT